MKELEYCPNFSVWLWRDNSENGNIQIARARCKQWSCGYCAKINREVWIARMLYATQDGKDWSFVTLTAHKNARSKSASHKNLAKGWNRLNLRLKRCFPGFSYVRVWELHKSGAFHAHFLWKARPSERWVKDNAAQCGIGYMADISDILAGEADRIRSVFYVAKYMTKDTGDMPKGTRRIVCSRNFPNALPSSGKGVWKVIGQDLSDVDCSTLGWSRGLDVYDVQEKKVLTLDDF